MRDFSDFLASMDVEATKENLAQEIIKLFPRSEFDLHDLEMATKIITACQAYAIALLHGYHDWMLDQQT